LVSVAEALLRYHPDSYCTAVAVVVDPPPRAAATIVTGGHHLPLRRSLDGAIAPVGEPGQVLGMLPSPVISHARVELHPGDVFVLFTDGVVEARRDGEFFGDARLTEVIDAAGSASAQDIADAVVIEALAFQHGDASDDIAVVAWKVLETHRSTGGATAAAAGETGA
jgi:sigma-B regulation protein RsbU (phosphoserine phosphatase)